MTTFVDTSVIIPLFDQASPHHRWCQQQVAGADRPLVIADIVYAELSVGMPDKEGTDEALAQFGISRRPCSEEALYCAGRAFRAYRDRGGPRESILPDFLVGAQADDDGEVLLTRDPRRVRTYFPKVELITPNAPPAPRGF